MAGAGAVSVLATGRKSQVRSRKVVGGMMSCCKDIIGRSQVEVVGGRWSYPKNHKGFESLLRSGERYLVSLESLRTGQPRCL